MNSIMKSIYVNVILLLSILFLQSSGLVDYSDSYPKDTAVTVSIFHNNDGESNLTSEDGYGNAASFVTLLRELRSKAESAGHAVLTLSSGDNFLAGTAFSASQNDNIFYDARVLEAIEYDAITLGNHDFDFGPDVLVDFIYSMKENTPFLSANLDFSQETELMQLYNEGRIASSIVIKSNNAHFGIVGATTIELASISSPRRVKVLSNLYAIIQTEVNKLVDKGINKIILVSHLQGIEQEREFITQLSDIDIVIAGGGDELLANEGDVLLPKDQEKTPYDTYPIIAKDRQGKEVPIVTTTGEYQYIGNLLVSFDDKGEIISTPSGGLIRVADPNSGQPDAVEPDVTIMQEAINPVIDFENNLANTVLASTEVILDATREQVRSKETNFGSLIADALLWQAQQLSQNYDLTKPDIAFQNGGGIRNSVVIKAGETISKLDTFTALPFPNFLVVLPTIPAAKVKMLMEHAVSQVKNKKGQFLQISGFRIEIDTRKQALVLDNDTNVLVKEGKRIITVQLNDGRYLVRNGTVVDSAPNISIATIDFLAKGGDQFPFEGAEYISLGVTYQQSLEQYLNKGLAGRVTKDAYPQTGQKRIVFK